MQRALSFRFSRPSPPLLSLSARPAARAVTAVRAYKGEDAVKGAASKVRRRDEGKREEGRKRKASRGRGGTPSFSQPPSPPLLLPSSQAKSAIASVGSDDVQDKLAALGQDIKAAWAKTDDKPAVVVLGGAALVALVAANAVVTTVDGVPVLSSLLQLIGLIVSGWFTYRYLAFKPDREELVRSIDAYLAKVLGK